MIIEKLELKGYKRIMLNSIEHIIYTPTAPIQLILGTNGCGKSSLLSELSPLPAVPANYAKNGFKKIWISHRGDQYYLESVLKGSGQHSFLKNGEELNPGRTGQVQRELVKATFGWTPALQDLLTGLDRFTEMGPMKRREWISLLSSVDYSYAVGVYKRLASRARDAQGALKHVHQRYTQETNNLKALALMDGMEKQVSSLRQEINLLLTSLDPSLPNTHQLRQQLQNAQNGARELSERILNQPLPVRAGHSYRGMEDVVEDLDQLRRQYETTREVLDRCTREYADLEAMANDLGQMGDEIPENLEELIARAQAELDARRAQVIRWGQIDDPLRVSRINDQILSAVQHLFSQMPDNSDRRYSREPMEQARTKIGELNQTIERASTRLVQINHRRGIIEAAKESQCPSCGYVWRDGYSPQELEQLAQWESEHQGVIDAARAQVKEQQLYLERAEEVAGYYVQLRNYVQNYTALSPLWDAILEGQLHLNNPQQATELFTSWTRDTLTCRDIQEIEKRLDQLTLMQQRKADGTLTHLSVRRKQLTEESEQLTAKLRQLKDQITSLERYQQTLRGMLNDFDRLRQQHAQCEELMDKLIGATRNDHINRLVHQHQDELSTIQRQLTERQTLEGIVADLERSEGEVKTKHTAYALLAKALSPTEGLIAEEMSGFITCLVDQINSIIASVWTYDLMIQPCGVESGELDYKFPLFSGNTVPDISKGSQAQRDIVNFAFVLTVMLYLDLQESPLYLDELGASFDEQHRVNVMSFVKQLMDSQQHPQLFMISHYAMSHGAFASAQTLVLDGHNIAVPQHHNEHVVFA